MTLVVMLACFVYVFASRFCSFSLFFPPRRRDDGVFFVFIRPCNRYMLPFSTYGVLVAAFLVFWHHSIQNSRRFSFFSLYSWSDLICGVLVPGTLAFYLLDIDFCDYLFITSSQSVHDHLICTSRGHRISTDTGCAVVAG